MAEDHWSADRYEAGARFVTELGGATVALLDPKPGERILDLGCGDGPLAKSFMDLGAQVIGVDASPDMIEKARALGVDAHVMDGHALNFDGGFDAVFSNAALHWMVRPDDVFAGVFRALRPGGRFVAEQGGHGNVAAIYTALISVLSRNYGVETDLKQIWSFPSPAVQKKRLEAAGFVVEEIALHPRPTPISTGMETWLEILAAPALGVLPVEERPKARAAVAELVKPALCDDEGAWTADYIRLRFRAVRP